MPPTLVDHGTPVISSRQWTYALSPNAASNGWNFITNSYSLHSTDPAEWVVLKDLTGAPSAPSEQIYDTLTGIYANSNFNYNAGNQIRALNGRIFFPQNHNYTTYYDPTTESVHQIGPMVEVPPIGDHAAQILYSATFDTAGILYMGTQESNNRPAMICSTDTDTLVQTVLGYVGSGALGGTTYAYRLAADTITAAKWIYVAFGEDPWQLWGLDILTGATIKLMDSTGSPGNVTFLEKPEGWTAKVTMAGGSITQVWCIDGVTYPYVPGYDPATLPFTPRSVTPASNPLVSPPGIDASGGIGVVGWRPNGSTGAYTYVNYSVTYYTPQAIESLVTTPDGVLGNAVQYQGFFRVIDETGAITWYGAEGGLDISGGPRLNVDGAPDAIYLAGYPNGVLYAYNPANPWQANVAPTVNPSLLGYYGPSGDTKAGIKYADVFAWSASAGTAGRLYCAGTRERTGSGAGIGYWDFTSKAIAGTFAPPLDQVQPGGLVALDTLASIVLSTNTLSGTGTAPLYVLDHDLNITGTRTPIATADLGQIFPTHSDPDVICGLMTSGGALAVYRYDVQADALLDFVVTAFTGAIGFGVIDFSDDSVWVAVGNTIVRVDTDTLGVTSELDITTIAPVSHMAFYGTNLYMASSSTLWSAQFPASAYHLNVDSGAFAVEGSAVTFSTGTSNVLAAEGGAFSLAIADATLSASVSMDARSGAFLVRVTNATMTLPGRELYFDLPTIPTQGKRGTATIYSDSPFVIQHRVPVDVPDDEE